jgi:membrane protein implicated in regulation of membrane protease activity
MEAWVVWTVVGVALLIIEVFTPGFVIACFGVACLVTALASLVTDSLSIQLIVFAVGSLIAVFSLRPLFLRYWSKSAPEQRTNADALVGQVGKVVEAFDPDTAEGRVLVAGEDWRGVCPEAPNLPLGAKVVVLRVESTKLFVKPLAGQ